MSFEQFLREFQAVLRRGLSATEEAEKDKAARAKKASKEALDYVFGLKRAELDKFRPTQLQTRDFVDFLLSAINQENKALSPDRKAAPSRVLSYNEAPGKAWFANVDPHVFAFQLALRIREPSLMNQKKSGVCSEASLQAIPKPGMWHSEC